MQQRKNTKPGKVNLIHLKFVFLIFIFFSFDLNDDDSIKTTHTNIKVLDNLSLSTTDVKLYGLYDPDRNNFDLNMTLIRL